MSMMETSSYHYNLMIHMVRKNIMNQSRITIMIEAFYLLSSIPFPIEIESFSQEAMAYALAGP